MDHPLIGSERRGGARQSFAAARRGAYVPPLNLETSRGATGERLERHLAAVAPSATAVATRPAPTRVEVDQAAALLREITPRSGAATAQAPRRRFSLSAPLRSVKRWFGC
jgi:hypothetical protein